MTALDLPIKKKYFDIGDISSSASAGVRAPVSQDYAYYRKVKGILQQLFSISVERIDDGMWVASHPIIFAYGYGNDPIDAASEFFEMMVESYIDLENSENELSQRLQDQLEYLRGIISN